MAHKCSDHIFSPTKNVKPFVFNGACTTVFLNWERLNYNDPSKNLGVTMSRGLIGSLHANRIFVRIGRLSFSASHLKFHSARIRPVEGFVFSCVLPRLDVSSLIFPGSC